jgi:N-acetylmuramic acid 6-phosphate etherase
MVDVKPSNVKLRQRAARIVEQVTGIRAEVAAAVLEQCDYEVKTAIIMTILDLDVAEARHRLQTAGGYLRAVIG